MIAAAKICTSCQQPIRGRADKKFCNDYCRNTHHNQQNSDVNNGIRNINHCLLRNRRVLETVINPATQIGKTSRQYLQNKGFSFRYFTHCQFNKKGSLYYFCYEYGYRMLEKEQVLVIRRKITDA